MQLFVLDKGFVKVYGMKSKAQSPQALRLFTKEVGLTNAFILDPSEEQTPAVISDVCHNIGTTMLILEERTQNADRAELYIGILKEAVHKYSRETHDPMKLWCNCAEHRAAISKLTAKNLFQLQGHTPHSITLGEPGDVSNLCQFGWYEWCYFSQGKAYFPEPDQELDRCIGPSKNQGNELCQIVLQMNGRGVPHCSLRRLCPDKLASSNASQIKETATTLNGRPIYGDYDRSLHTLYEYEIDSPTAVPEADLIDAAGKHVNQQSVTDLLINAQIYLPQGGKLSMGKVIHHAVDKHGKLIGTYNDNPILNSHLYEVEFPDGEVKELAANVLAENFMSQVDFNGHHSQFLYFITNIRCDYQDIAKDGGYNTTK